MSVLEKAKVLNVLSSSTFSRKYWKHLSPYNNKIMSFSRKVPLKSFVADGIKTSFKFLTTTTGEYFTAYESVLQNRKDSKVSNAGKRIYCRRNWPSKCGKKDAEGNLLLKKPRLHHEMLEHIPAPAILRTKIFDQIVLGAENAPARKMKKQKNVNTMPRDVLM